MCLAGGGEVDRWRWSRPDVEVYTMLVNGLAASLRVSDSLNIIRDICRVGISPAEEVIYSSFCNSYDSMGYVFKHMIYRIH